MGEWVLTNTFILAAVALAAACTHPWLSVGIGPLGMVLLAGGIWVALLTPLVVKATRRRFPLVLGLLILLPFSSGTDFNDNHKVRRLSSQPPAAPLIVDDFEAWMLGRSDYQEAKKYPVFIVVTEGGGIRNAYWTALVLSALQDQSHARGIKEFKDHLYCISGVSGGSVGATVYAALVREDEHAGSSRLSAPYAKLARAVLSADLLSPLLARGTLPDLAQQFLPWPMKFCDRQGAFEEQIERAWDDGLGTKAPRHVMSRGFWALRSPTERTTSVPALLLNTTRVESGERVLVGHVAVGRVPSVFDDLRSDIPLSTAGALSARFPVVTPVGTVKSDGGKTRFADGGYFENSGAATAQQALRDLVVGRRGKGGRVENAEFHVLLLSLKQASVTRPNNSWSEMLSPLRALLNARGARGRDAIASLAQFVKDNGDNGVREIILFEFSDKNVRLPLGWQLSSTACDEMEGQLNGSRPISGIADNTASAKSVMDLLGR
jgi:predicted acylesterase/phospholipase RssA